MLLLLTTLPRLLYGFVAFSATFCSCQMGMEEYLVVFAKFPDHTTPTLELYITSLEPMNIRVDVSAPLNPDLQHPTPLHLAAESSSELTLNSGLVMRSAGLWPSVISVKSHGGSIHVQAFGYVDGVESTVHAGYIVHPVSSLSHHYTVLTNCPIGHCVIVVVAAQAVTDVTVTLTLPGDATLQYRHKTYSNGESVHEVLHAYQALQVLCWQCDMSGTQVKASNPVAVVTGTEYTLTLGLVKLMGVSMTQVNPLVEADHTYVMTSSPFRPLPDMIKVMALRNGSVFKFMDTEYTATFDRQVWNFSLTPARLQSLTADGPLIVGQYQTSNDEMPEDPATLYPVPVRQWQSEYRLRIPGISETAEPGFALLLLFFPNTEKVEDCMELENSVIEVNLTDFSNDDSRFDVIKGLGGVDIAGVWIALPVPSTLHLQWKCGHGTLGGYLSGFGTSQGWTMPLRGKSVHSLSDLVPGTVSENEIKSDVISTSTVVTWPADHSSTSSLSSEYSSITADVSEDRVSHYSSSDESLSALYQPVVPTPSLSLLDTGVNTRQTPTDVYSSVMSEGYDKAPLSTSPLSYFSSTSTVAYFPATKANLFLARKISWADFENLQTSGEIGESFVFPGNVESYLPFARRSAVNIISSGAIFVTSSPSESLATPSSQSAGVHSPMSKEEATVPSPPRTESVFVEGKEAENISLKASSPYLCHCPCDLDFQRYGQMTNWSEDAGFQSTLIVPKDELSSTRRRKTSAEDNRTSSSVVGVYMTTIPVLVILGIFYADCCHQGITRLKLKYGWRERRQRRSQKWRRY